MAKVRTYRTLGEMLNDECSNVKDAFRTGSKAFQELSAKKKKKYEDAATQLKAEYQEKLAKYYEDHPDMVPVPKAKKTSRSVGRPKGAGSTSKVQLKRGRNRTPFNLFYESRLEEVPAITLQLCRQEWEELAVKDKLPFIRKSFESVEDTKLLNKKEQELFAISCGKPAFIGRTAYDYFQRQNRSKYDDLAPNLAAKNNYALAYQNYIKELPEAKQKVEIECLKSISSGGAGKKDKTLPTKKTKEDDHYPGSTEHGTTATRLPLEDRRLNPGRPRAESKNQSKEAAGAALRGVFRR